MSANLKAKSSAMEPPVRSKRSQSGLSNQSLASDNLFSLLAEELKKDGLDFEESDVSSADPSDMVKNMENIDDMEDDLFASKKKPGAASAQAKSLHNGGPKKDSTLLKSNANPGGADEPTGGGKRPNSAASSAARSYKKFTFSDDPLADLLDDLLPDETKPKSRQSQPEKSVPSASASPIMKNETTKAANKGVFTFNDEDDDIMDQLGFDSSRNNAKKKEAPLWSSKERSDAPQRPRTKIDDILEGFTSPRSPERPLSGGQKEQVQTQEKQEKTPNVKEDDLTFGSYQPTLGSAPEGRQSRRQSVRFSTEDVSTSTPERKPKPATHAPIQHRNSADWLGLKTNTEPSYLGGDSKETRIPVDSPKAPSSPLLDRKPSSAPVVKTTASAQAEGKPTRTEASKGQRAEEESDWFSKVLSRKKAPSETRTSLQGDAEAQGEKVEGGSIVSNQDKWNISRGKEDTLLSIDRTGPAAHSTPVREEIPKPVSPSHKDPIPFPSSPPLSQYPDNISTHVAQPSLPPALASPPPPAPQCEVNYELPLSLAHPPDYPAQVTSPFLSLSAGISHHQPQSKPLHFPSSSGSGGLTEPSQASDETVPQPPFSGPLPAAQHGSLWLPQQSRTQNTSAAIQQVACATDIPQQLLLQQQMMQTRLLASADAGALPGQPGDYRALQARIIQLEGQVKMLQLERDQSQMMLDSIQQRHKVDMELVENAHKARVKLLEESAAQRETRARLESEDLMERLAALTRSAEEERSALQAQYHRKLAQAQEDRDREVERLRDLQRKSILEMKKDHEDQVQRLKRLKDEEIDAVTSATSQTRSLAGVIEQMEQFSSRLGELSSRVESTHEHSAHGLEQGARHRDEQLRVLQDRLAQQQKATAEERTHLKDIISRMDAQLSEQQRQLEKERWKVTAEQAKAESVQRSLEEERRVLTMQISMEREELERAKSALLEEQKSVMQHCADERRKLASEWAHFHSQEKQRHERAEQEVSSLIERREGSIITLAQQQADLKLRLAELKQKEMAVAQDREALQRLREELDGEKERISSTALRLKTRAQEVEAFSKLASEKYEEGERALQEAKRVEAEHHARLRSIHSQTEQLRLQEQRNLKERMQLNHLQNTERMRLNLMSPMPQMIPPISPDAALPITELTPAMYNPPVTNPQPMALEASLALWRYTAEKDREFLQEEQIFLENLKKKSYKFTD
ncbi:fas-binding factor 1 homolog isoform 2-T2 [Menidia menidia]